ncbi:MAG: sulfate ABC transporter permease subunit CysT [Magnetococcales bacterium]|nr:sulfate ABC transporter permease subunit CysT [Magnetococcales bacterium]MBF0418716.1 sulfate ABC transporter permease subunit CysT [Magnetococcales bacterium]
MHAKRWVWHRPSIIPGFGISLGLTLFTLGLVVLLPLSLLFLQASHVDTATFWQIATEERALSAYGLSFGGALIAALVNLLFGTLIAWVLVRYRFPGKHFLDAAIDLPFALPTAVAGIALTTLWAANGWLGHGLLPWGYKVAYTRVGVVIAMIFVGLPFVVRTVQPVLATMENELEEAAISLGASRVQTFLLVIVPTLLPALATGFALAFSRAVGEYGSVVFIAGNLPNLTEIAPLLIMIKLEQYDTFGASVIACVMLLLSFTILFSLNTLQRLFQRRLER